MLCTEPSFVLFEVGTVDVVENGVLTFGVKGVQIEVPVPVGMFGNGTCPLSLASSRAADKDKTLWSSAWL